LAHVSGQEDAVFGEEKGDQILPKLFEDYGIKTCAIFSLAHNGAFQQPQRGWAKQAPELHIGSQLLLE
jgi:hypothetical protein